LHYCKEVRAVAEKEGEGGQFQREEVKEAEKMLSRVGMRALGRVFGRAFATEAAPAARSSNEMAFTFAAPYQVSPILIN
jgi:hypothetical protein